MAYRKVLCCAVMGDSKAELTLIPVLPCCLYQIILIFWFRYSSCLSTIAWEKVGGHFLLMRSRGFPTERLQCFSFIDLPVSPRNIPVMNSSPPPSAPHLRLSQHPHIGW